VALLPDLASNGGRLLLSCVESGTPAIVTSVGANSELVEPSQRARLPAPNASELADAIISALARPTPILRPCVTRQASAEILETTRNKLYRQISQKPPKDIASVSHSNKQPPTVSIIMAHYERPQFLEDAIKSVEAQDYPAIELVLVDDGSKKPVTLAYLKSLEPRFKARGWKIIRQKNKYLGAARNAGIKASRGSYILFLDDDNALLPGAVQTFIRALEVSQSDICTSVSKIFLGPQIPTDPSLGLIEYFPLGGSLDLALFHNSFGDANAIMRREVFDKVGYLAEDYGFVASDWEFFAHAAIKGMKIRIIPEATYWYRSSAQGMFRSAHWYETREPILRLFRKYNYKGLDDVYKLAMAQNTHESEVLGYHFRLRYDLANKPFEELDGLEPDSTAALEKLAQIAAADGQSDAALSLLGQVQDAGILRRVMETWSAPSLAEVSVAHEPLSPAEEVVLNSEKLREFAVATSNTNAEAPLSYVEAPDSLYIRTAPPDLVVATLSAGVTAGFVAVTLHASIEEFAAKPIEIMITIMDINIANNSSLPAAEAKKLILGTSGWKPLSKPFFKVPITVELPKPSVSAGTIVVMIRHGEPSKATDSCLIKLSHVCYHVYRGLGPARRPRLGSPPNFSRARLLTSQELRSAYLATQYASQDPLPLFKDGERGFQLLATSGGVTVAIMQWGFPPFARGVVASAELAAEGVGPVEISLGLARPTHLGSWTPDGPSDGIAFSGWRRISRSFELHDVELTIPEPSRHHLAICAAVRLPPGTSPTDALTFWRKFAVKW
jgi:GT2 family glycosyltransferase